MTITVGGKVRGLYGLSTFCDRASRFRDEYKIPAFDQREGTVEKNSRWLCERNKFSIQTASMSNVSHPFPSTPDLQLQVYLPLPEDDGRSLSALPPSTTDQPTEHVQNDFTSQIHCQGTHKPDNIKPSKMAILDTNTLNLNRNSRFQIS